MQLDEQGTLRFVSGAVLFPQRWSLLEKLGMDMHRIHEPVPLYEREIQRPVDGFMMRLATGKPFTRANWTVRFLPQVFPPPFWQWDPWLTQPLALSLAQASAACGPGSALHAFFCLAGNVAFGRHSPPGTELHVRIGMPCVGMHSLARQAEPCKGISMRRALHMRMIMALSCMHNLPLPGHVLQDCSVELL